MPGKIKVKILAGRNLPVMDRSGDTTDAYVEIKFGNTTYKTDVCRKSLNPQWNTEWYRFEVDDAELQDEPLQIRLMDHDTYSANDAIGKVYLNLNPLLLPGLPLTVKNIWTLEANMNSSTGAQGGSVMTGWIPVYDTMHGIRGEVNIIVKVELFSDFNKFRQSSCGVQFFYSPNVPHGYHAQVIHGFVEELIVSDDPEYKWIDKIRTPRASNEARQTLFFKISGEVQRKIGLKAMDLGGNAVIGYVQNFDLEGESGIVARGIGTAVTLVKLQDMCTPQIESANIEDLACYSLQSKHQLECSESDDSLPLLSYFPNNNSIVRSSSITHKTQVSNRFPKPEKREFQSRSVRIAEYHATSLKNRTSLQNSPSNIKKAGISSLSLSDDLITETSLRTMLALEDMRGERTSVFSRGLKNLRYFPKRVIQMKSKFADSFDDESDVDSTYSSSWSIVGSDTTRSSIPDLRQLRRKKFTHKKSSTESGVASLIRSVHTGFPLDSVREDRETPTPSPVNLLNRTESEIPLKILKSNIESINGNNYPSSNDCNEVNIYLLPQYVSDTIDIDEIHNIPEEPEIEEEELLMENELNNFVNEVISNNINENRNNISYDKNTSINIPMISSSETDTSTSDDDDPSESSTNYNILEDSTVESCTYETKKGNNKKTISHGNDENLKITSIILKENLEEVKETIGKIEEQLTIAEKINLGLGLLEIDKEETFCDVLDRNRMPEELIVNFEENHSDILIPLLQSPPSTPENEQHPIEYSLLTSFINEVDVDKSDDIGDVDNLNKSALKSTTNFKLKYLKKQNSVDHNDFLFLPVHTLNETEKDQVSGLISEAELESVLPASDYFHSAEPYMERLFTPLIDFESDSDQSNSMLSTIPQDNTNNEKYELTIFDSLIDKEENPKIFSDNSESILSINKSNDEFNSSNKNAMASFNRFSIFELNNQEEKEFDCNEFEENSLNEVIIIAHDSQNRRASKEGDVIENTEDKLRNDNTDAEIIFRCIDMQKKDETNEYLEIISSNINTTVIHNDNNLEAVNEYEKNTQAKVSSRKNSANKKFENIKYKDSEIKAMYDDNSSVLQITELDVDVEINGEIAEVLEKKLLHKNTKDSSIENISQNKIKIEKFDVDKEKCIGIITDEKLPAAAIEVMEEGSDQIYDSANELNKCIINKPEISHCHESTPPYKKYLFHSGSLDSSKRSTERNEKVSKKVTRTETVIYRGPVRKKDPQQSIVYDDNEKILKSTSCSLVQTSINTEPSAPVIVVAPPAEPDCYLRVPMSDTKDIKVHSPHPKGNSPPLTFEKPPLQEIYVYDHQLIHEKFYHKFRQHCMLDLMKTIDTKMMTHSPHTRKDSTRSKKRRRDKSNISTTPSPDSLRKIRPHRRNSRSKSPEKHHHHHHHHHHHVHQNINHLSHSSIPLVPSTTSLSSKKNAYVSDIPLDNLPKDNPCCSPDYQPAFLKDKLNPSATIGDSDESQIQKIAVKQLATSSKNNHNNNSNNKNNNSSNNDNNKNLPIKSDTNENSIAMDIIKPLIDTEKLLNPSEIDNVVYKSHSEGSLGVLKNHLPSPTTITTTTTTKTTNIANLNDPCVPCPHFCLRQQSEAPTSPVHNPSSVLVASVGTKVTNSLATRALLHRRSSDSDLSITPKGNSLAGSDRSMGTHLKPSTAIVRTMNQDALEMLEYPFLTIQKYPTGFVLNLGGLVSARSVKLIERISNIEEPESRDAWWTEIRMEVRSHARALGCNVVLGYKEEISICDDVCVLNASGTAAVINLLNTSQDQDTLLNKNPQVAITNSTAESDKNQHKSIVNKNSNEKDDITMSGTNYTTTGKIKRTSESNDHELPSNIPFNNSCNLCHLPYNEASVPFKVDVSKCAICKRAKVPDVLFTTIELPDNIPTTGRGVFIQATVCKCKRDLRGELNAKEISDCLPFLEYELHSLLLNKLKVKGMNAIFGLKVQVSIGERLIVGMAVGTAVFLTALPTPLIPQIASGNSWHKEDQLQEMQKALLETVKKNRELYRLKPIVDIENGRAVATSDTDESDNELPDLDLGVGTKDACILEVDDVEDIDRINLLMDESTPDDFHVVNTQTIPGLDDLEIVRNLQMFTQISRTKIPAGQFSSMPSKYFARLLHTVFFKLRRMVPCALCDMQFKVALPEPDEIQLSVVGMALGLGEPSKISKYKRKGINNSTSRDLLKKTLNDDNDLIFNLDEDQAENSSTLEIINQSHTSIPNISPLTSQTQKSRSRSPFKTKSHGQHRPKHVPLKERYGVDITPLSYLPGGKIERYLGNLNFCFIRESTSIRENGGLSGFTHSFITEVLAIVRAHITALGGNAMVAFFMTQCVLLHSPHKNQGQCLINVGGDVVSVSYFGDEKHNANC